MSDRDCRDALETSFSRERRWYELTVRAIDRLDLRKNELRLINSLSFLREVPKPLPLSNQYVRDSSRKAFVETIKELRERTIPEKIFLMTFAGKRGITGFVAPNMDFVGFQRAVYAISYRLGLSGIFSFEFDVVRDRPSRPDYPTLFHAHGVVTAANPCLMDIHNIRNRLARSRAFPKWNGADGINIKTIGCRDIDIMQVGQYFADPFHQLKRIQPNRKDPEKNMLRSTLDGLTPSLVLRANEIQSHLSIRDTVFGIGALGKQMRSGWFQRMLAYLPREAALGPDFSVEEISALWSRVRARDGSDADYGPVNIVTRSKAHRDKRTGL